jgi:hypothetical protein
MAHLLLEPMNNDPIDTLLRRLMVLVAVLAVATTGIWLLVIELT